MFSLTRPYDPLKGQVIHHTLVNPLIYAEILLIISHLLHLCPRNHPKWKTNHRSSEMPMWPKRPSAFEHYEGVDRRNEMYVFL